MNFPFEILLIFFLLLINGLFAMSEAALISSRKSRLEQMADDGDTGARVALELSDNPNRMLSTVQIGITLVGILSGAFGGATLSEGLALAIARIDVLAPYSGAIAVGIVVILITYFSLVIGELIPKRLALNNPEKVARTVSRPMRTLANITTPLVSLLSASTELGMRLLGAKKGNDPPVTEEEIRVLLQEGADYGVIQEAEQDLVESVFRLGDRRIDSIMTPRTEVTWLDLEDPLDVNISKVLSSPFNAFPVGEGSLDDIQGTLTLHALLHAMASGHPFALADLLHPAVFVPESTPALKVVEQIKDSGWTLAVILDEYGGVTGIVTQVDILESFVGMIPMPGEAAEQRIFRREDGSWLIDGLLQVDEFKELMDIDTLPDEDRAAYQTLGGFMMSQLGEIPKVGMSFDWEGYHFEVIDMDGRRVDKILIVPPGAQMV